MCSLPYSQWFREGITAQTQQDKKERNQMPTPNTFAVNQQIASLKSFFQSSQVSKEEKLAVWSILVALRGPDQVSKSLKEATTNVIRYALFGSTVVPGTTIRSNFDSYTHSSKRASAKNDHFLSHAKKAFTALGLPWRR
jgi:hypothetical protein